MTDITLLADSIKEGVRELAQENERLRAELKACQDFFAAPEMAKELMRLREKTSMLRGEKLQHYWAGCFCGGPNGCGGHKHNAPDSEFVNPPVADTRGHRIDEGKIWAACPECAALRKVAEAAVRYDDAIRACANDPEKMASFCSATGEDLDALYLNWMTLARAALAAYEEEK